MMFGISRIHLMFIKNLISLFANYSYLEDLFPENQGDQLLAIEFDEMIHLISHLYLVKAIHSYLTIMSLIKLGYLQDQVG